MRATPFARCLVFVILLLHAGVAWGKKHEKAATPVDPTLIVGDTYTIRSERHGARVLLEGTLVKLNERWLVLHHVAKARPARGVPILSSVPGVGQKFRSPAVAAVDEYLWIPREAATVESHATSRANSAPQPTLGEMPVLKVSCTVEIGQSEHVVRREGGLEAMSDDGLTLAVPRKVTVDTPSPVFALAALFTADAFAKKKVENRYTREHLSRSNILCIRMANFDPSNLTAQAR